MCHRKSPCSSVALQRRSNCACAHVFCIFSYFIVTKSICDLFSLLLIALICYKVCNFFVVFFCFCYQQVYCLFAFSKWNYVQIDTNIHTISKHVNCGCCCCSNECNAFHLIIFAWYERRALACHCIRQPQSVIWCLKQLNLLLKL